MKECRKNERNEGRKERKEGNRKMKERKTEKERKKEAERNDNEPDCGPLIEQSHKLESC